MRHRFEEPVRIEPVSVLVVKIGEKIFYANLEKNASAKAFEEKLSPKKITLHMEDREGSSKAGALPWALPRSDEHISVSPGDILLSDETTILFHYSDERFCDCTRLGRIGNVSREELLSFLGKDKVTVSFHLEWSE